MNNIQEYAREYNIHLIGHIPLIVNLASEDDTIREKSSDRLFQEVIRAHKYGISTLVLHPGSTLDGDVERGINCVIEAVNNVYDICKEYNVVLALETMSGQGTQIGSNFEELANIIQGAKNDSHLAICLDTCHLYSAGYQIKNWACLCKVLSEFDKIIGIEKVRAIHLNNTKVELGRKIDRHSSIFDGNICLDTFEKLVRDKRFKWIPMIIEPPSKDATGAEQVRYLKEKESERSYEG